MTLCDDGHDEICFDRRTCPLCWALSYSKELENKIEEYKDSENEHDCSESCGHEK